MENIRGIVLMITAMAAFSLEDMVIKTAAETLPTGQILVILGAAGALVFALLSLKSRKRLFTRDALSMAVLLRSAGELVAALGYVTALALVPLATAAAILQVTPLAITMFAALFLGESVGWRRWSAVCIGFFGVILIIQPGLDGFQPASLFALIGVAGLVLRDLATRRIPAQVSTSVVSFYGFIAIFVAGISLLASGQQSVMPAPGLMLWLAAAALFGTTGYYAIVAAMRLGDTAAIIPFRYARLLFSLVIGVLVFAEYPDNLTLLGATILLATGLYSYARELVLARSATA
ncbi:DMT family transporter [Candidatus Halocynthiibacter alkanivorans]|jgi:drug/metabolite transporter (DMT)-like permease|uniref:DMT family transporter n=1 Tax=Candidatus Halocynthiibacter alkanivorans TaxID=2267619 RepID=UPI000DF1A86E|nr:DMT family transporter [Candidatus Halocynthiibacter alkanivorans]